MESVDDCGFGAPGGAAQQDTERASPRTTKASRKPDTQMWYSRVLVGKDCTAASPATSS